MILKIPFLSFKPHRGAYALLNGTTKKTRRFYCITGIVAVCIVAIAFLALPSRKYHLPFQYIYETPTKFKTRPSTLPLRPFPDTPRTSIPSPDDKNTMTVPWLAAVVSGAFEVERRALIRATWWSIFKDVPFHGRFVVANPGTEWWDTIRSENQTYGDIFVLDHIPEDRITANTIKSLEMFKWLRKTGHYYPFVTKTDTDTFVNARAFFDKYLMPRLSEDLMNHTVNHTVIGQLLYRKPRDLIYPQGGFYTYSWDMVESITDLYEKHPIIGDEDLIVAPILMSGHFTANMANLKGSEFFDYDEHSARSPGSPWDRESSFHNAERHALGPDAIIMHNIKNMDTYSSISECFTSSGIREKPPLIGEETRPSVHFYFHAIKTWIGGCMWYTPRFDFIPKWYLGYNGKDWIIDGIWNIGPTLPEDRMTAAKRI